MATVALLGTCDTKLDELLFLRDQIKQNGDVDILMIDVGRSNVQHDAINITQEQLVCDNGRRNHGDSQVPMPRGETIRLMSDCASVLVKSLYEKGEIQGIIAAGGSGGTALAAPVMRNALPIGFPKMIVSTIASGDTGPIVGETDITMMHSVVDVAGLNHVLRDVLGNAGAAIAGAALAYASRHRQNMFEASSRMFTTKKRVAITMFGVTTPGVDAVRHHLESNYDIETYIFHATGHGGKAMERLIRDEIIDAVLDLTTTEICDFITGGTMPANSNRLVAAVDAEIPNIISLGATDMSNFGPMDTVPATYKNRKLYEHNPVITLMRSSEDECRQIGEFICARLRNATAPEMVEVWIPMGGVSMISTSGGPFEDDKADAVLFETIREGLRGTGIKVVDDNRDVNNQGFARDIAEALVKKMGMRTEG
ncbi:uncharacterized protein BCR38DRAFT_389396 [Pseudomassariella vexata]|uniref:Uncharacterized protein n=1 Tax=Pseudomassariella vexata TaxID=1141098 RepID=A0A1Y2E3F2_9PEZI|nr:uncharacterized protein BCR38DRAFT_389396 [Pseudomassariella vexata]ORY66080.1 hypothetical protein BCR38DRAFT_389396 [Pseudomassariella vexata]